MDFLSIGVCLVALVVITTNEWIVIRKLYQIEARLTVIQHRQEMHVLHPSDEPLP